MILEVEPARATDFDPRRDARSRVYEYRVLNQRSRRLSITATRGWCATPLDLDAMNEAARLFIGEHDFAAFRSLGSKIRPPCAACSLSEWTRDGARFMYRVEANSFMRHMVRTMVATMVEVGRGKLAPR